MDTLPDALTQRRPPRRAARGTGEAAPPAGVPVSRAAAERPRNQLGRLARWTAEAQERVLWYADTAPRWWSAARTAALP